MDAMRPGHGRRHGRPADRRRPHDWVARDFEAHRARLRAVAYRVLGSTSDADDAVQEAWLRLGRTDASEVDNLGGLADDRRRPDQPRHAQVTRLAARGPLGQ